MAEARISCIRFYDKQTLIYALVDPDTQCPRYVGKTVKTLKQRMADHIATTKRSAGHKRHVLAWIAGLMSKGKKPDIVLLETVPPMRDWVEAEQRWIASFSDAESPLCNLTIGGEGGLGYKPTAEEMAKRTYRRGRDHHSFGRPMSANTREALLAAGREKRKDPEWFAWWNLQRKAGYTPEARERSNDALRKSATDPEILARREPKRLASMKRIETRILIGVDSRKRWAEDRDKIIAAQNRGKGEEWRRKQSEIRTALWADPEWRARLLETRRLAFIHKRRIPVLV